MWQIFRSVYGERVKRISGKGPAGTREAVAKLLKSEPFGYDVLGGHVPCGIGQNCVNRPYQYFTVLRDPTNVVLSRYYKRTDPQVQQRKAYNQPGEFEENLRKMKNRSVMGPEEFIRKNNNPLIRFLSDDEIRTGENLITREHLEAVKSRLQKDYICLGFVERYQESVKLIAQALGWKKVPQAQQRNTGGNRPREYDSALVELGREINKLDYELYSFAEKLFDGWLKDSLTKR